MQLTELLRGTIPPDILERFSGRFDIVGSVAIVSLPPELQAYRIPVAEAILRLRKNVSTVLNKVHKIESDARTAEYEILLGDTTVTEYHEGGFRYRFDVARVFFSSRLAHERMRVAGQVRPGEEVLVPFCGVGPFAIPAAARGASVVAVEQNTDAVFWLKENIRLNQVQDAIRPVHGDAWDTSHLPESGYDRIIIPTPYGMDGIFDVFVPFTREQGIVHFYTFKAVNEIPGLIESFRKKGFDPAGYRPCGNVAPGISRWVFDLRKTG